MAHRPKRLDGSYALMVAGPGLPAGGTEGQFAKKNSDADYDVVWARVGFENLTGIPSDNDALSEVLAQKSDISHTHDTRYYRQEQTYTQSEVNTLLTGFLAVEPDPDWGGNAVTTEQIRALTIGDNTNYGSISLVPWTTALGTGMLELDLPGFTGGATFGGLIDNNRIILSTYGSVTGWGFQSTPYVGTNYIYHQGNLDITDYRQIADEKAVFVCAVTNYDDAITTGDGKGYFSVPQEINGWNLTAVAMALTTTSSSGIPTFQIANVTQAVDMLSTKLTVDAGDLHSKDATAAAVIDTANDDVATGDLLRFDCDVAGTGAKGVFIIMTFQAP